MNGGNNYSSGTAIRPTIFSFDVSCVVDEVNAAIVNVLGDTLGMDAINASAELYVLEKQLLTLAIRDEIKEVKPHMYVQVPYIDTFFKTTNGSGGCEISSQIFNVRQALHNAGLFQYLSIIPDNNVFLDIVYMKPTLYIHLKEI